MVSLSFVLPRLGLPRRSHSLAGLGALALGALALVGCAPQESSPSGEGAIAYEAQLAEHLAASGGVMYGAHWCPHCAEQKAMFSASADRVPYIECAADGDNAQPELCQQRGIQGYPTWEIGGQLYPGVQSLNELATLSGFAHPQ